MSEIRILTEAEMPEYARIAFNAYPRFQMGSTEKVQESLVRISKVDWANVYGVFREGEMVGGMIFYDFTMNFLGIKTLMGGIGFIAVDLVHKKERVARDMLQFFHEHYLEHGGFVTSLYPFRPDFYKRMGYGLSVKASKYRINTFQIPRGKSKEHIRFVKPEDIDALAACYQRVYEKTHGMCARPQTHFERLLASKTNVVVYADASGIKGYIIFSFKREEPNEHDSLVDLVAHEIVYENPDVLSELLTFLHDQKDQILCVRFKTQDENLHYLFHDPRQTDLSLFPSFNNDVNTQSTNMMYRILSVRKMFDAFKDRNFNDQSCKLKLAIHDSFLPENDVSMILHFETGKIVEADETFDVEMSADIADFSAVAIGAVNVRSLYNLGKVKLSDAQFLDVVDSIFRVPAKPICITDF